MRPAARAVVRAGLTAAAIDMLFAWAFWAIRAQVPVRRILQSVAAGLLGPAAYAAGWVTAALGATLHLGIALVIAAVYYSAARRLPRLALSPWSMGAMYGVCVYLVMNQVVVPLSAAGPTNRDPWWIGLSVVVHALGVGVPCALGARNALEVSRP